MGGDPARRPSQSLPAPAARPALRGPWSRRFVYGVLLPRGSAWRPKGALAAPRRPCRSVGHIEGGLPRPLLDQQSTVFSAGSREASGVQTLGSARLFQAGFPEPEPGNARIDGAVWTGSGSRPRVPILVRWLGARRLDSAGAAARPRLTSAGLIRPERGQVGPRVHRGGFHRRQVEEPPSAPSWRAFPGQRCGDQIPHAAGWARDVLRWERAGRSWPGPAGPRHPPIASRKRGCRRVGGLSRGPPGVG